MGDTTPGPAAPDISLDSNDRRLLDALQHGVPLTPRPFDDLARQVGLAEHDVLERLRRIRGQGLVSRISGIFDTRSLGYESVLVAAKHPPERVDAAAAIVSGHPGVSHNYLRTAAYNLWYTLAVPPDSRLGLERTAARLSELGGAICHRLLPATRVFKIGMRLALADGEENAADNSASQSPAAGHPTRIEITPSLKTAILALQEDLPAEEQPFDAIAARHGLGTDEMLAAGRDLQAAGIMRRYAAILRHRKVGFSVNCMTVWSVPAARAEQVGIALAGFREVTHCYERPAWRDWPYNLYAMIHCRSDEQCRDLLKRMKTAAGSDEMLPVYSTKEYKKVRLEYFSPAFAEWERQHGHIE